MNDFPETSEQPELLEAEWDHAQVDALFDDLQQGAKIHHVQVRKTAQGRPQDCQTTLDEARTLLHLGAAKAIQIRYTFDDQNWCDTLMVLPQSIRIIRTRGIANA